MKRILIGIWLLVMATSVMANCAPDEGMWLPMFVKDKNYQQMKELGLRLTPEQIYDINHSSLKDAIVNFGNFCTGEIISNQGLILTNHHCGYGAIQEHSSVEHDYLTDGFWANSLEEELKNESLTATFFVRMEDVTKKVLKNVTDEMTETERREAIKKEKTALIKEASEDDKYVVDIESFFNGNEYYLFVYKVYKDVRLVGAPPSAIGKFGGDTDNWMWPRHTGDFSIFRVYGDKDGNPAAYSEDNVPLNTKYALPISVSGVEPGDFAMIWGYPGSTDRYRTSEGINVTLEENNPAIDAMGGTVLDAMKQNMKQSDEVRIIYAAKYAQIANLWKNKKGESRGLKRLNVYQKKKDLENQLKEWINADASRKAKYGNVVENYEAAYQKASEANLPVIQWNLALLNFGSSMLQFVSQNQGLENLITKDDEKEINAVIEEAKLHFESYDVKTEKDILKNGLKMLQKQLSESELPSIFKTIQDKYKSNVDKYVDKLFDKSIFATEDNFMKFMKKPKVKTLKKDMGMKLIGSIMQSMIQLQTKSALFADDLTKNRRLFVAAIREMQPNKSFYPDANFTMRLTYGTVMDYYPRDGVHYKYYTTLGGVIEKEDPNNDEFIVPKKLKELYEAKDYGQFANKDGKMTTCFLTNNDITGGNSGSPVINGNGELIGVAFDGNWEAMSGDIAFEPELQRTISVDIRYVLFIVEKYANCMHIMEELNIVKNPVPKPFVLPKNNINKKMNMEHNRSEK